MAPPHPRDPSTASNYEQVVVSHYALNWKIDFEKNNIIGDIVANLDVKQDTSNIILDIRDLTVHSVCLRLNNEMIRSDFSSKDNGALGQKLVITTDTLKSGDKPVLEIKYETSNQAAALQFLAAEQTTDRVAPYLFSQCQAINARSIIPCMDTPSVKSTYEADVCVPTGLTCLMSAIGHGSKPSECGKRIVFSFKQPVSIPSYLLAIVVGHLERKDISERCAVWAEPSQAEASLYEFAETEKILKVAEDVAGPYVWGRYDLVVLPATFPFGGMENPCLTFITPTLLAGDRSLVNVIAHEISHSWTGNLVTNFSWEHFWLNEGFTVFLERKIHGKMFGELERQFESECGFEEALVRTVNDVFGPEHEYTKLVQNLGNADPDEAFSSIPYEKGSALLFTIEQALGDNDRFEKFLRSYIQKFSYKSVSTEEWKEYLYDVFSDKKIILDNIDWNLWLHKSGLPPKPHYDSTLMKACKELAAKWTTEGSETPTDGEIFAKMSNSQKLAVIDAIRVNKGTFGDRMPELTATYKLDQAKNAELKFSWLMLGLENKWTPIVDASLAFALSVGRMKYCKPIYRSLFCWSATRDRAISQFKANIPNMHPITVKAIQSLLK
uniref:Leuk-A4-hydro_C domain-containing protein n=1 Tax=Caenorhabditis tropicalis TaxID=1561998 RepID=A0A1I7TXC0_9PELO